MVFPVSAATASSASTTRYSCSSSTGGPHCAVSRRRLPSGKGRPRRILPVRRPQPSGLQTIAPTPLVKGQRHQLPLVVAPDQRIVDLMRNVAGPTMLRGNVERLHELPAGEVRDADIPNLAGAHDGVER